LFVPAGDAGRAAPGRLAALACYFTSRRCQVEYRKYRCFAALVRCQGLPWYTAELTFAEPSFVVDGKANLQRFRDR
jgi:hypothetical protein